MFEVYRITYYIDMKNTPDLYERLSTLPRNLSGSLARSALPSFAQIHTIILMCYYSIPDMVRFEWCKN